MKALALFGSALLLIYLFVVVGLTALNVSKWLFGLEDEEYDFFSKQATIMIWPLMVISAEGREALAIIWNGE